MQKGQDPSATFGTSSADRDTGETENCRALRDHLLCTGHRGQLRTGIRLAWLRSRGGRKHSPSILLGIIYGWQGDGDVVVAEAMEEKGVRITSIEGEGGRLPLDASKNCVGIAASAVLERIGADHGVSLKLKKA